MEQKPAIFTVVVGTRIVCANTLLTLSGQKCQPLAKSARSQTKGRFADEYSQLRQEAREWAHNPISEVMSFIEVCEHRLEEALDEGYHGYSAEVLQSYLDRDWSDLEWREFNKSQAEACGKFYCWAKERKAQLDRDEYLSKHIPF